MDSLKINFFIWIIWAIIWAAAALFTLKTKVPENFWHSAQHLGPLAVSFLLIFSSFGPKEFYLPIFHLPVYESSWVQFFGCPLTLAGLLFAIWSRIHIGKYWSGNVILKEGHKLIRSGPYTFVRHPIYTGVIGALLGSALSATTAIGFIGFAVGAVSFVFKYKREEEILTKEFGEEYLRFKAEVPALIPWTKA